MRGKRAVAAAAPSEGPLVMPAETRRGRRRRPCAPAYRFRAMPQTQDWSGRRLHFVGVGGAGMSGLALVARQLGGVVTGSDAADSAYCERLRAAGLAPHIG